MSRRASESNLPVTGHGIPDPALSGVVAAAQNYFALPESTKLEVRIPHRAQTTIR
jgi:isopenicillin N synthase-like dioxygenase